MTSGIVTVNQGTNKSFILTPGAGFQVADVLVDGTSAGVVTSYTFTNITVNHTISVTFKPANPQFIPRQMVSFSGQTQVKINQHMYQKECDTCGQELNLSLHAG